MIVFSVETSQSTGSLCLAKKREGDSVDVLYENQWSKDKSHSEVITIEVQNALSKSRLRLKEIDFFALGIGPGSFTGLRVSSNLIRSFAYAENKKVWTENSLKILALNYESKDKKIVCLNNAFKNSLFMGKYEYDKQGQIVETEAPCAIPIDDLDRHLEANSIVIGNGIDAYRNFWPSTVLEKIQSTSDVLQFPQARRLASYTLRNYSASLLKSWNEVQPLYIRASEAEEKLKKGLLKPLPKI